MSQKSRLDQIVKRYTPPATPPFVMTPHQETRLLRRIAEVTREQGGPEGMQEWMTAAWAGAPPAPGVDPERLVSKVVAMARVMAAETPGAKDAGWAELRAIGKH